MIPTRLCSNLTANKEDIVICPYEPSHTMTAGRMQYHIIQCRRNHPIPKKDYKACPFNAKHLVPAPELRFHMLNCPDKCYVDLLIAAKVAEKDDTNKGYTDVPVYNSAIYHVESEKWDICDNFAPRTFNDDYEASPMRARTDREDAISTRRNKPLRRPQSESKVQNLFQNLAIQSNTDAWRQCGIGRGMHSTGKVSSGLGRPNTRDLDPVEAAKQWARVSVSALSPELQSTVLNKFDKPTGLLGHPDTPLVTPGVGRGMKLNTNDTSQNGFPQQNELLHLFLHQNGDSRSSQPISQIPLVSQPEWNSILGAQSQGPSQKPFVQQAGSVGSSDVPPHTTSGHLGGARPKILPNQNFAQASTARTHIPNSLAQLPGISVQNAPALTAIGRGHSALLHQLQMATDSQLGSATWNKLSSSAMAKPVIGPLSRTGLSCSTGCIKANPFKPADTLTDEVSGETFTNEGFADSTDDVASKQQKRLEKKLRQIEKLEAKQKNGELLAEEEVEKLSSKFSLEQELQYLPNHTPLSRLLQPGSSYLKQFSA